MALDHDWESYDSDDGMLGVNCYWRCRRCGASGGVYWPGHDGPGSHGATIPGDGRGPIPVSDDCEEAARQMAADRTLLASIDRSKLAEAMRKGGMREWDAGRAQGWLDMKKELEPWQKKHVIEWLGL